MTKLSAPRRFGPAACATLLALLPLARGIAQDRTVSPTSAGPTCTTSAGALPPLDVVQTATLLHSPATEVQRALMRKNAALLARTRRAWTDRVALTAQTVRGSYGDATVDRVSTGTTIGVGVRLSIYDVVGRPTEVAAAREELAISTARRAEVEDGERLRTAVIWHRASLGYRLIGIRAEATQAAAAHLALAEREYRDHAIPLAELSRVQEIASKAVGDFEAARTEYATALAELDVLVGRSVLGLPGACR